MRNYRVEVLQQGQTSFYNIVADNHISKTGDHGQTLIHFYVGQDKDKRPTLRAAIVVSARDSVVMTWAEV